MTFCVRLVIERGPMLGYPYSLQVRGSKFGEMRELRVQHEGRPYRVFYAFDSRRTALLLIGSDKTGDDRFYEEMVPKADALFAQHLVDLEEEKRHGS